MITALRPFIASASAFASLVLLVAGTTLLLLSGATPGSDVGEQGPLFVAVATIFATAAVGFVVALRRPANPIGWIFSAQTLGLAISFAAAGYATYALVHPGSLPGAEWGAWLTHWSGRSLSGLSLLAFFLFPDGRLLSERWRGALLLPPIVAVGFAARAFVPGPMDVLGVENPAGLDWVPRSVDDGILGGVPLLLGTLLAFASVALRFRRSHGREREQMKWLALPVLMLLLAILGTLFTLTVGLDSPLAGPLGNLPYAVVQMLLPISMGVAILRYRLYDIDVLINRALVYGATTAAIAAAFFGGIVVLQAVLRPITGGSEIAVAVSTLASVALFQPLRVRVQRAVDRRFYRARYDATRTLDEFSVRLRDQVALDAVRADLLDAVRETVQPAHASVWLREGR